MPKSKEKWFQYFDDGPTTPFPGFKIKVADDIQTPIAILPVQTAKGFAVQERRAKLIVRLFNEHSKAKTERTCVHCGCTDSLACPGGCNWTAIHSATPTGVCSNCADKDLMTGRSVPRPQKARR
jgi:hypothetical protein